MHAPIINNAVIHPSDPKGPARAVATNHRPPTDRATLIMAAIGTWRVREGCDVSLLALCVCVRVIGRYCCVVIAVGRRHEPPPPATGCRWQISQCVPLMQGFSFLMKCSILHKIFDARPRICITIQRRTMMRQEIWASRESNPIRFYCSPSRVVADV